MRRISGILGLGAAALLLGGAGDCGGEPITYAGSTWEYEFNYWNHTDVPVEGEFSQLNYSLKGTFTLPDEPTEDSDSRQFFDAGEHAVPDGSAHYVFEPEGNAEYGCAGSSGKVNVSRAWLASVQYTHRDEALVGAVPLFSVNKDNVIYRNYILMTFGLNGDFVDEIIAGQATYGGNFEVSCWDDNSTWQSAEAVPVLPVLQYSGRLANHTTHWRHQSESGATISSGTLRLTCLENCVPEVEISQEPTELEEDLCDPQVVQSKCDAFRADALETCKTLEDWMVVEANSGQAGTKVTCATADCSNVIAANESRGPEARWATYNMQLDSACEVAGDAPDGGHACSVECYGWYPAQ